MTYIEARNFIKETHDKEIRLGLERITELLKMLGNPHKALKFIHVAGTNGKGSVCAMTSAILKEAGYRTGLFTSPVIYEYREQFRIDGMMISEDEFVKYAEIVKSSCMQMEDQPSEFEKAVAIAFLYFKEMKCDFVVLEVGMGGIGDATNVISVPEVAVIVNIDYDHMNFLGNTLTEIAQKKAGIIKENGTVIIAEQSEEVMNVLAQTCHEKKAEFKRTSLRSIKIIEKDIDGQLFDYKDYVGIKLSLLGNHQCENAAIVLEIIDCLIQKGYRIPVDAIYEGLGKVQWIGRFEIKSKEPLFILDGAHNPNGIEVLCDNLKSYFPKQKFIFITGILRDKDYKKMLLMMLPYAESFVTIAPDNPRAMNASECAHAIRKCGFEGEVFEALTIEKAVAFAYQLSEKRNTGICAFGSLYSVGRISKAIEGVFYGKSNTI